jgi:hypothetical protein
MLVDSFASGGVSFLRVIRVGRTLRPLRVIRGNPSMRVVVSSLINSFTDVVNVYILAQFVTLLFAILGVSLFSGQLYRCNIPSITTRDDCVGEFVLSSGLNASVTAVWANPSYGGDSSLPSFNFDNVLQVVNVPVVVVALSAVLWVQNFY